MKASRITAIGLVAAAGAWIVSGQLLPRDSTDSQAAIRPAAQKTEAPFRVSVATARVEKRSPVLTLSGRTEADHKVMVTARAGGVLTKLNVRRGQHVKKGEIIAVLSDEAREAKVAEAKALLAQRKAELDAKRTLIQSGSLPRLNLVNLEAQYTAAQAALASAQADYDRGIVRAPWAGVITDVPAEVGGAAFSVAGKQIAELVSLDPMLAVVEVSERKLAGIKVGQRASVRLITGQTVTGHVRYVSKVASPTTRTYRVEVKIANPDGRIPDGITVEVSLKLEPVAAAQLPRSALTISSDGDIGVRVVDATNEVKFIPIKLVEDRRNTMWVAGVADGAQVIVRGQDFVREGQIVAPIAVDTKQAAR